MSKSVFFVLRRRDGCPGGAGAGPAGGQLGRLPHSEFGDDDDSAGVLELSAAQIRDPLHGLRRNGRAARRPLPAGALRVACTHLVAALFRDGAHLRPRHHGE